MDFAPGLRQPLQCFTGVYVVDSVRELAINITDDERSQIELPCGRRGRDGGESDELPEKVVKLVSVRVEQRRAKEQFLGF